MRDIDLLRQQGEHVSKLRKAIDGSLGTLQMDYEAEIAKLEGKPEVYGKPSPPEEPFCIGLEWSLREETWELINLADELTRVMDEIKTRLESGPYNRAYATVPEENLDEYTALLEKYNRLRIDARRVLASSKEHWETKIKPFLATSED